MKAIRVHAFGGPEVMQVEEIPTLTPGPGQVLVHLKFAGVNPVETYIRSGTYPVKPPLPYTPGSDGAGVVEAVGAGASRFKRGDRVYVERTVADSGTYATHALCDLANVHDLPEIISFQQGAAIGVPYATAYRALFHRAKAKPGETVFIHGATGAVGLAATQWAVSRGCIVIGTGGTEKGRALVALQGAAHVLDHRSKNYLAELTKLTADRGPNVILEMLSDVNLDKDLAVIGKFGRIVTIGSRGRVEIDPRQAMGKEVSILGMSLPVGGEAAVAEAHAAIGAGLRAGFLKPVIDREFDLTNAKAAHEAVMADGSHGKIVIKTQA